MATGFVKLWYYQDEQQQKGGQDQGSKGVGDHCGRLLLWLPK